MTSGYDEKIDEKSAEFADEVNSIEKKSDKRSLRDIPHGSLLLLTLMGLLFITVSQWSDKNLMYYQMAIIGGSLYLFQKDNTKNKLLDDLGHWKLLLNYIKEAQSFNCLPMGRIKRGSSKLRTFAETVHKKLFGFSIVDNITLLERYYLAEMLPTFPGSVTGIIELKGSFDASDNDYLDIKELPSVDVRTQRKIDKYGSVGRTK